MGIFAKRTDFRKAERRMRRQEKLAERGMLDAKAFRRAEWGMVKTYSRTLY